MTTALWLEIPTSVVQIDTLIFCQNHLTVEGLLKAAKGEASYCGDTYPHLVRFKGKIYIVDGHHRIVVAVVRGQSIIEARLLER